MSRRQELQRKVHILERIRYAINDALRDEGPELSDTWLKPIRDFRKSLEDEEDYLKGLLLLSDRLLEE